MQSADAERSSTARPLLSTGTLEDRVEVDAAPEAVWAWLTDLADHYTDWHPDHGSATWIRGEPNQIGSRLKAVETVVGHRESLVFELTAVDPPWRMEYRILGPHAILLPGGAFAVSRRDGGSVFEATIRYRFGRLAEIVFGRRMAALRTHMREEGQQLKHLVEATGARSPDRSPPV